MIRIRCSLLVAILCLPGCLSWHRADAPLAGGSLEGNPKIVQVTRTSGCGATPSAECISARSSMTLYSPRVDGDSLVGRVESNEPQRVAMHVRDIVSVKSGKVNRMRTAGLVLGTGAVLGLAYAYVQSQLPDLGWSARASH